MKFEEKHAELLSAEWQERFKKGNFPDGIIKLLNNFNQKGLRSGKTGNIEENQLVKSIILAYDRPSFLIRQNTFDPAVSNTWNALLSPALGLLSKATESVGRIELENHNSLDWAGTGFLVDENIIVTNRHVADHFVQPGDHGYDWKKNSTGNIVKARIDFREEYMDPINLEIEVIRALYVEPVPGPDIALLEVIMENEIDPLELSSSPSANDVVVTIGYPWKDTRVSYRIEQIMERIFGNIYDVKRLAPGRIVGLDNHTIHHDCTTLGGNSGSAVLDAETGKVVALHYGGDVLYNNAVSANIIKDCLRKI